jgi:formylglycine-generating enzyme required for sulfatase activity
MPLTQGLVLNQRYRIVKLLGQGGFGAVYRAWDMNLNGPCAVKENFDATPEAQKQFSREASLLFNLRHPHLPKVIDQFSLPGQGQYLVMEYIEGEDLDQMMNRLDRPLTEAEAVPIIAQVCDALSYLHSRTPPIIHRDIKPANVRVTPDGVAYLVDFGVAKTYDPDKRTTLGARAVTPGYAPFEQYGQRPTDARSDVYALGATLYHTLTRETPPESISRMAGEPLISPRTHQPEISVQVDAAILHALELQPDHRFSSVSEFKTALLAARPAVEAPARMIAAQRASNAGVTLRSEAPAVDRPIPELKQSRVEKRPSRLPAWTGLAAGAAILVLLAAGAIAAAISGGRQPTPMPPAAIGIAAGTLAPDMATGTPAVQDTATLPAAIVGLSQTTEPAQQPSSTTAPSQTSPPTAAGLLEIITDAQGVKMALIPAGVFWMGSLESDPELRADELPRTQIELPAFYMDVTEVTNAQYAACVQAGVCAPPGGTEWNDPTYSDYPVAQTPWEQADRYCEWRGGRLPTEAEWEKAARGGLDGKIFPWGDEPPVCEAGAPNAANFTACGGKAMPVASYAPNGYGLYDTSGNVWEWVSSGYLPYPYQADDGREDPAAATGSITRGGSWYDQAASLRAAQRGAYQPSFWLVNIGFRCARSP